MRLHDLMYPWVPHKAKCFNNLENISCIKLNFHLKVSHPSFLTALLSNNGIKWIVAIVAQLTACSLSHPQSLSVMKTLHIRYGTIRRSSKVLAVTQEQLKINDILDEVCI